MAGNGNLSAGQFKEVFPGTRASNVDSSRECGLTPPVGSIYPAKWYMLTSKKDEAGHYAHADDGAVITYHVPTEAIAEYGSVGDEHYLWPAMHNGPSNLYAVKRPLPGSMIHQVDVTAEPRPKRSRYADRTPPARTLPRIDPELRKMNMETG